MTQASHDSSIFFFHPFLIWATSFFLALILHFLLFVWLPVEKIIPATSKQSDLTITLLELPTARFEISDEELKLSESVEIEKKVQAEADPLLQTEIPVEVENSIPQTLPDDVVKALKQPIQISEKISATQDMLENVSETEIEVQPEKLKAELPKPEKRLEKLEAETLETEILPEEEVVDLPVENPEVEIPKKQLLNDLVQEQESPELSMRMLKAASQQTLGEQDTSSEIEQKIVLEETSEDLGFDTDERKNDLLTTKSQEIESQETESEFKREDNLEVSETPTKLMKDSVQLTSDSSGEADLEELPQLPSEITQGENSELSRSPEFIQGDTSSQTTSDVENRHSTAMELSDSSFFDSEIQQSPPTKTRSEEVPLSDSLEKVSGSIGPEDSFVEEFSEQTAEDEQDSQTSEIKADNVESVESSNDANSLSTEPAQQEMSSSDVQTDSPQDSVKDLDLILESNSSSEEIVASIQLPQRKAPEDSKNAQKSQKISRLSSSSKSTSEASSTDFGFGENSESIGKKPITNEDSTPKELAPLPENYFLANRNSSQITDASNTLKAPSSASNAAPSVFDQSSLINKNRSKTTVTRLSGAKPPPPKAPRGGFRRLGSMYELSNYNWPYESYMGRWAKALLYNWNNHPPADYIQGLVPNGGDVFVLVTLNSKGQVTAYEVTDVQQASDRMTDSVINAILGVTNLPPLPSDFEEETLQVHFRFIYPPIWLLR